MKTFITLVAGLALLCCVQLIAAEEAATKICCDVATVEKHAWCEKCASVVPADGVDADGKCKACGEKPMDVDCCVKKYFWCETCSAGSIAAGKCACGADMKEMTSIVRVCYTCACGCKKYAPGNCEMEGCADKGKPLTKSCDGSGAFPHVDAAKWAEAHK